MSSTNNAQTIKIPVYVCGVYKQWASLKPDMSIRQLILKHGEKDGDEVKNRKCDWYFSIWTKLDDPTFVPALGRANSGWFCDAPKGEILGRFTPENYDKTVKEVGITENQGIYFTHDPAFDISLLYPAPEGKMELLMEDVHTRQRVTFWIDSTHNPASPQTFGWLKQQLSPVLKKRPSYIRFFGKDADPKDDALLISLAPLHPRRPLVYGEQFSDLDIYAKIGHKCWPDKEAYPGIFVAVLGSMENSKHSVKHYENPNTTVADIKKDFLYYGGGPNNIMMMFLGQSRKFRIDCMNDNMKVSEIRKHLGYDS